MRWAAAPRSGSSARPSAWSQLRTCLASHHLDRAGDDRLTRDRVGQRDQQAGDDVSDQLWGCRLVGVDPAGLVGTLNHFGRVLAVPEAIAAGELAGGARV